MAEVAVEDRSTFRIDRIYIQNIDLMERLAFLQEAIRIGKGQVIVGQIINDLLDYAQEHFGQEEDYLQPYLYAEYEEHKVSHREFREKVEYFYYCFQMGAEIDAAEVADFLQGWIKD
jgi:hemerythrin